MMNMSTGFWQVARVRGVPIRIHWSVPLGTVVFTRFSFAPGAWVAFFLLVLFHELGHAAMVRWARAQVLSVDVMGFGGLCRWAGSVSALERAVIAWGGVWAQLLMLLVAVLASSFLPFGGALLADFYGVMIQTNLFMIALNLLPIRPLDGAEAWPLFGLLKRRWQARPPARPSHLKVVPKAPSARPPDPKRDEIFQRMVQEATRHQQPLEPEDPDESDLEKHDP